MGLGPRPCAATKAAINLAEQQKAELRAQLEAQRDEALAEAVRLREEMALSKAAWQTATATEVQSLQTAWQTATATEVHSLQTALGMAKKKVERLETKQKAGGTTSRGVQRTNEVLRAELNRARDLCASQQPTWSRCVRSLMARGACSRRRLLRW